MPADNDVAGTLPQDDSQAQGQQAAPAQGQQQQPATQPVGDDGGDETVSPETVIQLEDGSEVTVGQLTDAHARAARLERIVETNARVMRGERVERDHLVEALMAAGYSRAEAVRNADSYGQEPAREERSADDDRRSRRQEQPASRQTLDPETRRRLEEAEENARTARLQMLEQTVHRSVTGTIDSHDRLATLLEGVDKSQGRDQARQAYQTLSEQIRERTIAALQARVSRGERFSESWIEPAVKAAADQVYSSFRAVIGDPSALGRSPETDDGAGERLRREPVPAPQAGKIFGVENAQASLREWNADQLSRALDEMRVGGASRA